MLPAYSGWGWREQGDRLLITLPCTRILTVLHHSAALSFIIHRFIILFCCFQSSFYAFSRVSTFWPWNPSFMSFLMISAASISSFILHLCPWCLVYYIRSSHCLISFHVPESFIRAFIYLFMPPRYFPFSPALLCRLFLSWSVLCCVLILFCSLTSQILHSGILFIPGDLLSFHPGYFIKFF